MEDLNANDLDGGVPHDDRLGALDGPRGGGVGADDGETGKRLKKAYEGIDRDAPLLRVDEAVKLIKARATAKFDETIEVAMNLNVDPRKPDQNVRGTVMLPHGTGKTRARRASSPRATRPRRPRPPAPTSSAPRTSPRRSRPGRSISTAASPRPT